MRRFVSLPSQKTECFSLSIRTLQTCFVFRQQKHWCDSPQAPSVNGKSGPRADSKSAHASQRHSSRRAPCRFTRRHDPNSELTMEAIGFLADLETSVLCFAERRWPDGPVCPKCRREPLLSIIRACLEVQSVCEAFSVKVGTVLKDSPIGLDEWLKGFCGCSQTTGTSSVSYELN